MPTFPAAGYLSDAERTQAEQKAAFEAWLAATRQLPGAQALFTLTIAAGQVTPVYGTHRLDTEGAAPADDLTVIAQTNLDDGAFLWLRSASAARVVTIKHAAGGAGQVSIADGADLALTDPSMWLLLQRRGTLWEEVGRFWGNQRGLARLRQGMGWLPVGRGADLTAASALVLGADGDYFHVTGGGAITSVTPALPVGQPVRLVFEGAPTVYHSTNLILAGGTNFVVTAGDSLTLVAEPGGVFREVARRGGAASLITEYATAGTFTWTKPTNVSKVWLSGAGPGGPGGGGTTGGGPGGGGGGGAGEQAWRVLVDVSGDLTIVIPAAGVSAPVTVTGAGLAVSLAPGSPGGPGSSPAGGNGGGYGRGLGGAALAVGNPGTPQSLVTQGGAGGGGGDNQGVGNGAKAGGPAGIVPGGAAPSGAFNGGGGGATLFAPGGAGGASGVAGSAGARGSGGGGGGAGFTAGGPGGLGVVRIEVAV